MNDDTHEHPQGRRTQVSLASLYLDPNNYRIVDHSDYSEVAQENVLDSSVQRRTTQIILGNNQENVKDLMASFITNGWLELDPILIQEYKHRTYVVLEGNRRVAALKHLSGRHQEASIDLGNLDPAIFSKVPVVLHVLTDEKQKLVIMGLHHISGKKRWPAINRALAIRDLKSKFYGNINDVCDAAAISKREVNLSLGTLALIDTYKESNYGHQFRSEKFNLFREIISNTHIREWLDWDQQEYKAARSTNVERLFRWMSSTLEYDAGDSNEEWESTEVEPVLAKISDIRKLAKIVHDQDALTRLDNTRNLQEAVESSTYLAKNEVDQSLASIEREIRKLTKRRGELTSDDLDGANTFGDMLKWLAAPSAWQPVSPSDRPPRTPFNQSTRSQFSYLRILEYRGLGGLELNQLRRINLITGVNNAGKTSLLEAIYLLTRQNDEHALLDVYHWRGKFERHPGWAWFEKQIPARIRIEGQFDDIPNNCVHLDVHRVSEMDVDSWNFSTFLAKFEIRSCYADREQHADIILTSNYPPAASSVGRHWLCQCSFASPFWIGRRDALVRANKAAVEIGTKVKIVQFIMEHIDDRVTGIELVDEFKRFLVPHKDFKVAPDLSTFGDGMSRIFEIGMLFASTKGGVLLVDEFENAIHKDLLVPFTRLVQALASELNVQVFLTSHSKEAIDAFVSSSQSLNDVVGFAIQRYRNSVGVRRYDGKQLKKLHEALDFDLRGIKGAQQ